MMIFILYDMLGTSRIYDVYNCNLKCESAERERTIFANVQRSSLLKCYSQVLLSSVKYQVLSLMLSQVLSLMLVALINT